MKALLIVSVLITSLFFCGCSTKDDVILAAPSDRNEATLVSSNNGTEQAASAVELENRFKGCKAHW